jgi:hypothetical protein
MKLLGSVKMQLGVSLALIIMLCSLSVSAAADDDNHGTDHSKGHSNDSKPDKKVPKGNGWGHGDHDGGRGHGGNGGSGGNGGNSGNGGGSGSGSGGGSGGSTSSPSPISISSTSATASSSSATLTGSTATNGGQANTQTTVYKQVQQAPFAYSPDAIPSAPCRVGGSAGVSAPIGGVSLGGSKLDTECDLRETARAFSLIGNRAAAAKILCQTKAAKKAHLTDADCQVLEAGQAEPPAPSPVQIVLPSNQPAPPIAAIADTAQLTPVPVTAPQAEPRLLGICTFAKQISCKPETGPAVITVSSICKQMLEAARKALGESPNSVLLVRGNHNPSEDDLTATARANNVRRQLTASGVDPGRVKVETGKGGARTVELVLVPAGN